MSLGSCALGGEMEPDEETGEEINEDPGEPEPPEGEEDLPPAQFTDRFASSNDGGWNGLNDGERTKTEFIAFNRTNFFAERGLNNQNGTMNDGNGCLEIFLELTPAGLKTMMDEFNVKIQNTAENGDKEALNTEVMKLQEFTAALNTTIRSVAPENKFATSRVNRANSDANYAYTWSSEKYEYWAMYYANRAISALSDDEWIRVRSTLIKEHCTTLMAL